MKYKVEKLGYFERLKKQTLYPFLILLPIIFIIYIDQRLTVEAEFSIVAVTLFFLILISHLKAKSCFHEVTIDNDRLILQGDNLNKLLIVELPVSETTIQIKSKGGGAGSIDYYLCFTYQGQKHQINRLFNWNYADLIDLIYDFKREKGEKIIWDEKYLIEHMEKKIGR